MHNQHTGPRDTQGQGQRGTRDQGRRVTSRRPWRQRLFTVAEHTDGIVAAAPVVPLRQIFRRFWPYARPDLRALLASLLLVAVAPVSTAASIWVFKQLVDTVLIPRDLSALAPLALALAGITVAGGVLSYANSMVSAWLAERFLFRLRDHTFGHLLRLSPGFFERHRTGDLVSRLTGDVAAIERLVLSGITQTASYAVRILVFAGLALYLRWELALLAFVVAPLFWIAARHFSAQIKRASREKRRRTGALSAVAEETLAGASLVQAYGQEPAEAHRFRYEAEARMRAGLEANRMSALYTPAIELIELLGALLVLGVGAWQVAQGRLTVGGLLAFVAYLAQLYSPIRGASRLATTVYSASAGAERLIELLDSRPDVESRQGAFHPPRIRGAITLSGVSYTYPGSGQPALDRVDLSIAPGEVVAVTGPSGAGKSTLTKLLLRSIDPQAGAVRLDGIDIRFMSLDSLRSAVAIVLQEITLFDRTVAENIAFGVPTAAPAAIQGAAWAADADSFIRELPEGYATRVGQRGRRLSGGQRQRVAIARALLRQAPVLILDEPTSGLDKATAARVMDPLRRLMTGRTTIMITHDPDLARLADRVVRLDRGRLLEERAQPAAVAS